MSKPVALLTPEQRDRQNELARARRKRNPEAPLAADKAYRAANADRLNARDREKRRTETPEEREARLAIKRARYQQNREENIEYQRRLRAEKPELVRERNRVSKAAHKETMRTWWRENRERMLAWRAKYTEANRERIAARNAAWSAANLDRHRAHQSNRRARKKANGGKLSPDIVQRLFALQRGRCACCGAPLGDAYDLDHIVPLALGGANSDDNVQLLTARCNRQKGASDPVAFMQQRRGRLL